MTPEKVPKHGNAVNMKNMKLDIDNIGAGH